MIIRIQDLRQSPKELDVCVQPADLHISAEGVSFPTPVEGHVRFQLFGERVRVAGELKTTVSMACIRCLEAVELPICASVDLVFEKRPETKEHEQKPLEVEWDAESRGTEFYEEELIDATDSFRQLVLLELPNYPLCKEDCKGLCLQCGARLNQQSCSCADAGEEEIGEPDWKARLKQLRLE